MKNDLSHLPTKLYLESSGSCDIKTDISPLQSKPKGNRGGLIISTKWFRMGDGPCLV